MVAAMVTMVSCQKEEPGVQAPTVDEMVGTWVTPDGLMVGQLEMNTSDFVLTLTDGVTDVEFTGKWYPSILQQCPWEGCKYPTIILDNEELDINTRYIGHSDGAPAIGVHFNTPLRVGTYVIKAGDYFVFSPAE